MPGMFFHAAEIWATAIAARDRAIAAGDWAADAPVAVILAVATAEAFINELAEHVALTPDREPASANARAFADAHAEAEQDHGGLLLKYVLAARLLDAKPFDRGANPYQDFKTLVQLRNDILHLKPLDEFEDEPPHAVVHPRRVTALRQRGLASPDTLRSWFNALQTKELAVWACDTARAMMADIVTRLPNEPFYEFRFPYQWLRTVK